MRPTVPVRGSFMPVRRSVWLGLVLCALGSLGCNEPKAGSTPPDDAGGDPGPPLAPTLTFTAAPESIMWSGKTTLSWKQTDAKTLSLSPDAGAIAVTDTARMVSPEKTTTYTLTATNEHGSVSQSVTVTVHPYRSEAGFTFYGAAEGLSDDIHDVSPDEGGNVYVAGGDALYVKTRGDEQFLRFDAANGGLSRACFEDQYSQCDLAGFPPCSAVTPPPDSAFFLCTVQAVAGAKSGQAIVGYRGYGDAVQHYTDWATRTGGADVVVFDPLRKSLRRARHVWIASPPHTICTSQGEARWQPGDPPCTADDGWWNSGRRLFRNVLRIAVNHDVSSPKYGDAWFCGEHGTFAALFNEEKGQRYLDRTAGFPEFADTDGLGNAKSVWEHEHPTRHDEDNSFINEKCWSISIDPRDRPWASNQYRTAFIDYPASTLSTDDFGMSPYFGSIAGCTSDTARDCAYIGYDIWADPPNAATSSGQYYWPNWNFDAVIAVAACPDGRVWVGSFMHGLAEVRGSNYFGGDDPRLATPIQSLACDVDNWLWIGFQDGTIGHFDTVHGTFQLVDTTGAPGFATHVVQNIQIDRWTPDGKSIVYFAFGPVADASGKIIEGGGVAAYRHP
jgi:hypothetical protein